jgi:3-methyladenine DNA glycosylase AlkD
MNDDERLDKIEFAGMRHEANIKAILDCLSDIAIRIDQLMIDLTFASMDVEDDLDNPPF